MVHMPGCAVESVDAILLVDLFRRELAYFWEKYPAHGRRFAARGTDASVK